VLAPGLRCVFCGINPGRVSAAAAAHFANPRNDFWRLLHDAGFTPRLHAPEEQLGLLELGLGVTNAAYRTTPGSGDLRKADFAGSAERLERIAREFRPLAVGFVGKEAYRGAFGERPELGLQERRLTSTLLYVLPSTSPANAAVHYAERLRWFRGLHELLEPADRPSARAVLLDARDRILLMRFVSPAGERFWATPGGGVEPGEDDEAALRRELAEEAGLHAFEPGPCVWTRESVFVWERRVLRQRERFHLVRVEKHEVAPELDLAAENVHGHRWWTLAELESTRETVYPTRLAALLRELLEQGPPSAPLDAGV
jgi:G:T/U-mismatch repair DNA glycosylase/ADP-ribose pyrophosphatase YjhB (NUDIX family)